MRLLFLLIVIFNFALLSQPYQAYVSGNVINSADKSFLTNANVIVKASPITDEHFTTGTITDSTGNFKIELPYGSYILIVSYIGYKTFEKFFALTEKNNFVEFEIELNPTAILEKEITVTGERNQPSTVIQEIEPKDLKRIPTLYNDVLRAVQILPGVSTSSELSSGYNVRGGNFDDNSILTDLKFTDHSYLGRELKKIKPLSILIL